MLILYKNAFDKATEIQRHISGTENTALREQDLEDAQIKQVALQPLQFEALLHLGAAESIPDELGLSLLITQAQERGASQKTYSLMADIVLSATLPNPPAIEGGTSNETPLMPTPRMPQPHLPIMAAVTLLRKLINAVRQLDEYDLAQASRWIRCAVQITLDSGTPLNNDSSLRMLDEITAQAVILASSSGHDADVEMQNLDHNMHSHGLNTAHSKSAGHVGTAQTAYPSDELEWLATTLFNLALDLMVAGEEGKAKDCARRAVEVADSLAKGPDGDRGVLARVLRERGGRLRWL